MDVETAQMIAETSARAAAAELGEKLSQNLREDFNRFQDTVNQRISLEFQTRFGDMKADQHVIQHDRLERFLKTWDKATGNLFGKALVGVIVIGLVIALGGELILAKVLGFVGVSR